MASYHDSSTARKRECALCGHLIVEGEKVNRHHLKLKSEGGAETIEVHARCHVEHHSKLNHFREWGRRGGLMTAARGWWIFNLKFRGGVADPLRWIPFGYGQ